MARIAVVTVQFNNPDDTLAMLGSIAGAQRSNDLSVTIVDNSSDSSKRISAQRIASFDGVQAEILTPGENLYYWGGAAFALERVRKQSFDWFIVCNNDVSFTDPDFFDHLAKYDAARFPILAPRIIASSGDQNPLLEKAPGWLRRARWRVYDSGFLVARSMLALRPLVRSKRSGSEARTGRKIYAPHGACVILAREFFERGGGLDVQVPLFAEELTLAAVAHRLGMSVWFDPSMTVVHREHTTTGHRLTREKYELERAARRRYYELERTG